MAKIILSKGGNFIQEMEITKERTTIGRRPHNDLVIDNLGISSEHAVIITIYNDSFLEDLNSTNGTQVNGHPITKHFLQHNDVIQLAKHKLLYLSEEDDQSQFPESFVTLPPKPEIPAIPAAITVLDGPNIGKKMLLVKEKTTIGRTGVQVACIVRRTQGYALAHIEGIAYPRINGVLVSAGKQVLKNEDVIDIAGTMMRFSLLEA
ncbi:FHA domain-containing protein [Glaciimonas soli]|uniref:FHA domain-containing protein n=1 Tax=Glaciimonas soli TaxID=2590999 RepID=A0A843YWP8_9BURK|nr:FHA domain-containing protein [Glaciimonas soli]MQR01918.1 FHA domain-containing protein [Glaciimonas soli]